MDDNSVEHHRVTGNSMKFALLLLVSISIAAQSEFTPPRLADGHPDFGGIWMAASLSAAFNVEEHGASYGTPAGPSVIVDPPGGKLPYLPGMRERAADNDQHRERDPVGAMSHAWRASSHVPAISAGDHSGWQFRIDPC